MDIKELCRNFNKNFGTKTRRVREDDKNAYLPTPEEIKAKCKEIRESWTAAEKHHRSHGYVDIEIAE